MDSKTYIKITFTLRILWRRSNSSAHVSNWHGDSRLSRKESGARKGALLGGIGCEIHCRIFQDLPYGRVFVLLPLLIFYLLLSELLGLVVALATPIADLFPKGTFDNLSNPVVVAILLLIGVSFIFGLVLRSRMLARMGSLPIGASAWRRSWFPSEADCVAQAVFNDWQRNRRPFPESRWCASEDHGGWRPLPSLGSRRCRPSPCRRRIGSDLP
jgi:hypothetical protein